MLLATRCGFTTPDSIIPADTARLKAWAKQRRLIVKPLAYPNAPSEDFPGYAEAVMTLPVNPDDLEEAHDSGLKSEPHFFQERIEKDYEIRVQATRHAAHAFKIDSQSEPVAQVDWRLAASVLDFEVIELPRPIRQGLKTYLEAANLHSGAFDFIVDKAGEYVFLECNRHGQWWWLGKDTGAPISIDIAGAIPQSARERNSPR